VVIEYQYLKKILYISTFIFITFILTGIVVSFYYLFILRTPTPMIPIATQDNNNNGLSHKIDKINSLFHSGAGHHTKGSAIDSIPVIPKMNFATTANGTTTTANVTIPVCNGVVGGPCLDPNTRTIIP
jgi:hypothetical protein